MADTPRHSVSVAGIVVDDQDRVLVIQRRDNGHWEPPGGVLELAETPEQGVRREVREETGVEVEVERLSGVYKNIARGIVALVFRCKPLSGAAAETEESKRVAWRSAEEWSEMMSDVYRVRVEDALSVDPTVRVKTHNGQEFIDLPSR